MRRTTTLSFRLGLTLFVVTNIFALFLYWVFHPRSIQPVVGQTSAGNEQTTAHPRLSPEVHKQLEADVQTAVTKALRGSDASGASWEISQAGFLVVTVELPTRRAADARLVAQKTVLAVRNAVYGHSPASGYRVNINGPSPGPNLVHRYGSATFLEGGAVDWDTAGQ